jgi:hypothetical protein
VHILIPDDPVLAAGFLLLEQPLLSSLRLRYRTVLTDSQAKIIEVAHKSWGELQRMLPRGFHAHPPETGASEPEGCVLETLGGQRLTTLYAVDPGQRVGHLEVCYMMLRQAQIDGWPGPLDVLDDVLREIGDGVDLVDRYGRVLQVLRLPSPPRLLAAVRQATPPGPATPVTLSAEQEREYRGHCEKIIGILSGDDGFAYAAHRALYM